VTEFVLKLLKKRLFSSPAAFASTLAQHEKSLRSAKRSGIQPSMGVLQKTIERVDEEYSDDAEREDNTQEAIEAATSLIKSASKDELQILNEMRAWAHSASASGDSKLRAFVSWIKDIVRPNGKWTNERVIIFTEYRATQKWLQTFLASGGPAVAGLRHSLFGASCIAGAVCEPAFLLGNMLLLAALTHALESEAIHPILAAVRTSACGP
jgi:hypothetical protein